MRRGCCGLSIAELLVAVALLGLLALPGLRWASGSLVRQRLEHASRRVALGLEWGRAAAQRSGRPCALRLTAEGWQGAPGGELPDCLEERLALVEDPAATALQLEHNLPEVVRFTSNGLVLDGGTVRLAAAGTPLVRCVVVSLPLGVVRIGRWQEGECRPDPSL
ncbi:MAG: GspH/FimT family protein [Synechococcaceae cyanobacterium]|nr:GspH/FimT family protein [Synechococcaceae cyanobacterium]